MAGTDPAATAVCDAGPLIHLSELGVLDLLRGFAAVTVPSVVWEEVERHRPGALGALASFLHRRDVRISLDPRFQAVVQALSLDAGEQAALSCDELQEGALLLTDDAAARLAAKPWVAAAMAPSGFSCERSAGNSGRGERCWISSVPFPAARLSISAGSSSGR